MMKSNSFLVLGGGVAVVLAIGATACDKSDKSGSTNTSSATTATANGITTTEAKPKASTMPVATAAAPGKPVVTWKGVGLSTPESVLHDETSDVYLVSNVDGKPTEADGKGFISKLAPDGTVTALKWIEGGKNKAVLNAPKGMTIANNTLYVADIDTVRMFDAKTGAPTGEVKIPGATFLNDIATATDGRVLVSDTGVKAGAKGFDPTGTDAVYAIEKDNKKVTTIAKSKDLGGPNGLLASGDKTWVVTFNSGELYSLDAKGKKADVQKLPKGSLDGIILLANNDLLISSWESSSVYRGKPGGDFKVVIEDVKSPADISYDVQRGRVLVPLFQENEVRAYDLK